MSDVFEARSLDEHGRCCGRKPLVYKRPDHHYFCAKCDAEFTPDGKQRPNWAWLPHGENFVPKYPNSNRVAQLRGVPRP
jgi:hypothetical protein